MWELLQSWWLVYALIVGAQALLQLTVGRVYQEVKDRLDRRYPDDLPVHTGQWVRDQLQARGLEQQIAVVSGQGETSVSDSYWPSPRLIHLAERTFFKKDPTFWAVGAHELGHALTQRSSAVLAVVFPAARLSAVVSRLGAVFLLTNLLYADPWLTGASWWLYVAGLGATVIVLVDEALASVTGLRLLRTDARLTAEHLRAARIHLGVAWATYVAAFGGGLLVLVEWQYVHDLLAQRPPVPWAPIPESLVGEKVIAGMLVGLAVVRLLARSAGRAPSLPPQTDEDKREERARLAFRGCAEALGRWMVLSLVATLLWRLWDVPLLAAGWPVVVALAAVPVVPLLMVVPVLLTVVAATVVLLPVFLVLTDSDPTPPPEDPEPVTGSPEELASSKARIEEAEHALRTRPPGMLVAIEVLRELTVVPLAVVVLLA